MDQPAKKKRSFGKKKENFLLLHSSFCVHVFTLISFFVTYVLASSSSLGCSFLFLIVVVVVFLLSAMKGSFTSFISILHFLSPKKETFRKMTFLPFSRKE
jgi:hypothetical protein